ncbi:polysaccharide biosynthesis/export family protein [Microbulbifer sp. SAOS-129_SWC]|uniref:polysaccharide biosynthesis/export family protein n=1 Tax=Microbulbifer sp. SAOS-129_SWC TaxID=3145235 RepID=UPI003216DDD6
MNAVSLAQLKAGVVIAITFIAMLVFGSGTSIAETRENLAESNYLLNCGDRISIRVYGEDDLSMEMLLDDSGVINYPFLGEIKVAGLSPKQLKDKIRSGLQGDYLVDPSVEVAVVDYRPFFIKGEVNTPGSYSFQPGLTVNKAVAMASGFTVRASQKKITIERTNGDDKRRFQAGPNMKLHPGDVVTVEQSFF